MAARYRIYKFDTSAVTGTTDTLAAAIDDAQTAILLTSGTGTITGTVMQMGTPPTVDTTGGSGAGAVVTVQLTGGVITGLTVVSGGSGYLTNFSATINGSGTGASVTLTVAGGLVTGFTSLVGGTDYNFENMLITAGGGTATLTVVRAWAGTVAAAWINGATVNVAGEMIATLWPIADVPNHKFTFVKTTADINYVSLVPIGGDTLQSGAVSVLLADSSPQLGSTRLEAPGSGTVWIQFGGGGYVAATGNGVVPGGAPQFNATIQGYGSLMIEGFLIPGAGPSARADFLLAAVDETDAGWWGQGTIGTANPTTFVPTYFKTANTGQKYSRFGRAANVTGGGGTGYTTATVTITGDGSGAQAHCTIAAGVVTVVMDCGGSGYGSVSATIAGDGTGASVSADLVPLGVGDYFVWNDVGNYEVCQVQAVDAAGGGLTIGRGFFGSPISSHGGSDFFRCVSSAMSKLAPAVVGAPLISPAFKFGWENLCVVGVAAVCNGNATIQYLAQAANAGGAARPGLRTLSGAAYTSPHGSGAIYTTQTSDKRVSAQEWQTIKCVYGKLRTAPATTDVIVYAMYLDADGVTVGCIDAFKILVGQLTSYSTAGVGPAGRQMPYHAIWATSSPDQLDWPPNKLPTVDTPLDANGNLVLTVGAITLKTSLLEMFQPDGSLQGSIDFIVQQGDNLISTGGGGGVGAIVQPVITDGAITAVIIINGAATTGSYTSNFSPTIGGGGTGASLTFTVSGGLITGITSLVGGAGYSVASELELGIQC